MPPQTIKRGLSPLMLVCCLFATHSAVNSLLLSPFNSMRCSFWGQTSCTSDEDWMCNWYSFSHLHVSLLLASMVYVSAGSSDLEVALSNCVMSIILVHCASGIFSIEFLHRGFAMVHTLIFITFLAAIAIINLKAERSKPLMRKLLSTSSFDRRQKLAVSTASTMAQLTSALFRLFEMVHGTGRSAYVGDVSSRIFQNMSSLALTDMMIVAYLLATALYLFEPAQLKLVLCAHAVSLFVSQIMIAGSQGDMIAADKAQAGGVGTLVSIIVSIIGAL